MKGWQLLKEIAEGNIKEGNRFINSDFEDKRVFFYTGNDLLFEDNAEPVLETMYLYNFLNHNFELIEEQEEINIQNIEKLTNESKGTAGEFNSIKRKVNEILQAVKQLDNKIKENKE